MVTTDVWASVRIITFVITEADARIAVTMYPAALFLGCAASSSRNARSGLTHVSGHRAALDYSEINLKTPSSSLFNHYARFTRATVKFLDYHIDPMNEKRTPPVLHDGPRARSGYIDTSKNTALQLYDPDPGVKMELIYYGRDTLFL